MVNLLPCFFILKSKTGGSRPAERHTFARQQKCLLLAEGISFAEILRYPITTELNKAARYRGPLLRCDLQGKSLITELPMQSATRGEVLKSLGSCGGNVAF